MLNNYFVREFLCMFHAPCELTYRCYRTNENLCRARNISTNKYVLKFNNHDTTSLLKNSLPIPNINKYVVKKDFRLSDSNGTLIRKERETYIKIHTNKII